jgi:hypothetical protein
MRTLLRGSAIAAVAFALACGGGDSPPTPATITFSPDPVSLDAIGATTALTVVVNDDKGRPIENAVVTWMASGPAVTLTPPASNATGSGTHTASVTAAAEGQTLVRAAAGGVSATLNVVVDQRAVTIVPISGDNQVAAPGSPLGLPIAVQLRDRLGAAVTDASVTFEVVDGGGSVAPTPVSPDADGVARTSWTLGSATTIQHLSASDAVHNLTPVTFTATAVASAGLPAALIAASGGNQALMAGAAAVPPAVRVVDGTGNGVAGIVVNFAVTAGGGSISDTRATTGADGVAALTRWTMGPVGSLNAVTATVPNLLPLEFDDAGCDSGGATGFAITLCYRTTMTASQRQAFAGAAAKWATIVSADLPDISATFSGVCGGTVPVFDGTVDDLLIFATVEPIDGPSNIVGSAGPCIIRTANSLPIIGTMRFDVADVVGLENVGLLNAVILHEMGHVLGVGSLWSRANLVVNTSSASQPLDTYFNGVNGLAGFDAIGGASYTGGNKVPVENTGGTGTINSHWRESVLRNELMTGTINGGGAGNPLSLLTVRSLQDLGYTVNTSNADPFFLTLAARLPGAAVESVALGRDVLAFPLWTVDARGRLNRTPR